MREKVLRYNSRRNMAMGLVVWTINGASEVCAILFSHNYTTQ